ncbi:MAG TPA: hypothetical protein H9727_05685 [Candidatus Borkfalkia avistercoris]|uniref:Uncharacterized protein n=1 Tax=Candidatus Borkfalkia avistercoris TaxID=2838504 RepID=A0A9D2CZI7_9FIRM|nr:hypothetical protein [Candidatus Borkfalkia avistercoris]
MIEATKAAACRWQAAAFLCLFSPSNSRKTAGVSSETSKFKYFFERAKMTLFARSLNLAMLCLTGKE